MSRPRSRRSIINPLTVSLAVGAAAAVSTAYFYFKSSSSSSSSVRSKSPSSTRPRDRTRAVKSKSKSTETEHNTSSEESDSEDEEEEEEESDYEIEAKNKSVEKAKKSTTFCLANQKKLSMVELAILLSPESLNFLVSESYLDTLLAKFPNLVLLYFPSDFEDDDIVDVPVSEITLHHDDNGPATTNTTTTNVETVRDNAADPPVTIPVPNTLYSHFASSDAVMDNLYKFIPCQTAEGASNILKHLRSQIAVVPKSVPVGRKTVPEAFVKNLWKIDDEEFEDTLNKLWSY